jgi:hypothetical protein
MADPTPPSLDYNFWKMEVLDSSGKRLSDVSIAKVKAWMPDHGHGSPVTPVVTYEVDRTIAVKQLYFFMNGLWQVTLTAQSAGGADSVTFSFCIGG